MMQKFATVVSKIHLGVYLVAFVLWASTLAFADSVAEQSVASVMERMAEIQGKMKELQDEAQEGLEENERESKSYSRKLVMA